jgi:hypothetical protein
MPNLAQMYGVANSGHSGQECNSFTLTLITTPPDSAPAFRAHVVTSTTCLITLYVDTTFVWPPVWTRVQLAYTLMASSVCANTVRRGPAQRVSASCNITLNRTCPLLRQKVKKYDISVENNVSKTAVDTRRGKAKTCVADFWTQYAN